MDAVGQNAFERKYRFGYSFKNPKVVKTPYRPKHDPWFKVEWASYGPTQVKEDIWKQSKLPEYPAVWRRASKRVHVEKLGIDGSLEMSGFNELGQAPGPTDKSGTTEGRNVWGFLENIATRAGDIVMQREQTKLAQAQAELQSRMQAMMPMVQGVVSYWPWILGIGVLGVGAYMVARR
jgi:hypothetical protein